MLTEQERYQLNNFLNNLISLLIIMKGDLVQKRNEILDSIVLRFFLKKNLAFLDTHLDIIDRTIAELQKRLLI